MLQVFCRVDGLCGHGKRTCLPGVDSTTWAEDSSSHRVLGSELLPQRACLNRCARCCLLLLSAAVVCCFCLLLPCAAAAICCVCLLLLSGDGNLGLRGMALFFRTHECNLLCSKLKLEPFERCATDVAAQVGG